MKISQIPGLGRFGIIIDDVDLTNISHDEWMEIGKLHLQNLVTVIRNTGLTKERYGELIDQFGKTRVPGYVSKKYKDLYNKNWKWLIEQYKTNSTLIDEDDKTRIKVGMSTAETTSNGFTMLRVAGGYNNEGIPNGFFSEGELRWHADESGTLTYAPGVALLGQAQMVGSATGFITTTDYYESVSESFRSELNEMIICHRYFPNKIAPGLNPEQEKIMLGMCPIPDTEVPLVMTSPGGITGLHYSVNTIHTIKGMTKIESDRVFKEISKGVFVKKYIYDHWYKHNDDLLLFDNSITLHRRLGKIDGRTAYRIPFDYTNLQEEPWLPYSKHPEYHRRYCVEIRELIKMLGNHDFKLPPITLKDRLQNWFAAL